MLTIIPLLVQGILAAPTASTLMSIDSARIIQTNCNDANITRFEIFDSNKQTIDRMEYSCDKNGPKEGGSNWYCILQPGDTRISAEKYAVKSEKPILGHENFKDRIMQISDPDSEARSFTAECQSIEYNCGSENDPKTGMHSVTQLLPYSP
jgi:hypothetical protein